MNLTMQSPVQSELNSFERPMMFISNEYPFNNSREELNTLSKRVLRAINQSEARFENKSNREKSEKQWVKQSQIHKRDSSSVIKFDDKIYSEQKQVGCLKNTANKNSLPNTIIELDSGILDHALKNNGSLDLKDNNGITPLMEAAGKSTTDSDFATIRDMIHKGAKIDTQDKQGNTAIIWLIKSFYQLQNDDQINLKIKVMDYLYNNGTDMTLAGTAGFTPMMYAVAVNNSKAFNRSYRKAEDFKKFNNAGETALHLALKDDSDPIILNLLVALSRLMNIKDNKGHGPFMIASFRGLNKTMDTILKNHANINEQDTHGWTALMHAVNCDDEHTVDYLLGKGANAHIKNCCNKDVFMMSRDQGKEHILSLLLSKTTAKTPGDKGMYSLEVCKKNCQFAESIAGQEDITKINLNNVTWIKIPDVKDRHNMNDTVASKGSSLSTLIPICISVLINGAYLSFRHLFAKRLPLSE
ncbi:ankyrin repeat domain-containing protein [Sodalis sp. dw_96]|uniref:ankyrin repeat domain-containing protein n=1 Tax=Sodalis sp. dw_96 TaxID=2719794 RepID=UPI001BD3CB93|nr:ankyrin repeat domain-containing protein [Sodalis sp. dw_96]